ncbi:MAG: hypothetical protein JWM48_3371 [Mycobacterium sp.]|nr:hypothetical protein [Mycobacterium sp.]
MTTIADRPTTAGPAPVRRGRHDAVTSDFQPGGFALQDTWIPLAHAGQVGRRVLRRPLHGADVYVSRDRNGRLRASLTSPADEARGRRIESWRSPNGADLPLVERYGYAWVWFGAPERADVDLMPNIPHIPVEGVPRHMQQTVVFDCSNELVAENLLDLTHADFLHSAITGDSLCEDDRITIESTSETVTMTRFSTNRPVPKAQRMFAGADMQDLTAVTFVHVRSGVCLLHGNFQPGMSVRMLHPCNPETRWRSRTPVSFNLQNTKGFVRHLFPAVAHVVGSQDNWAVKPQNPMYVHAPEHRDENSRFDAAGIRYRLVLENLVERQKQGDLSYLPDGHPGRDIRDELLID